MDRPFRHAALATLLALSMLAVVGCTGSASPSVRPSPEPIVASEAWARASMSLERAVAVYLVLDNQTGTDDALVSVASPAGTAEIHETVEQASGMMGMHPVGRIEIASGSMVELKPGSYHIMLIDLAAMLEPGTTIELTLTFEHAPPLTVTAEVRAS